MAGAIDAIIQSILLDESPLVVPVCGRVSVQ